MQAFSELGTVKDVRQIKDRFTGMMRDIAFVEFGSEEEANLVVRVVEENGMKIGGENVSVVKSKDKKERMSEETGEIPVVNNEVFVEKSEVTVKSSVKKGKKKAVSSFTIPTAPIQPAESATSLDFSKLSETPICFSLKKSHFNPTSRFK